MGVVQESRPRDRSCMESSYVGEGAGVRKKKKSIKRERPYARRNRSSLRLSGQVLGRKRGDVGKRGREGGGDFLGVVFWSSIKIGEVAYVGFGNPIQKKVQRHLIPDSPSCQSRPASPTQWRYQKEDQTDRDKRQITKKTRVMPILPHRCGTIV